MKNMPEYIDKAILLDHLDIENALGGHYGISLTEINKITAADVRPVVHGRWKDAIQSCHDSPHVKCSVCGEYYWRYFNKFNFCPNCGADMRDKQEDYLNGKGV